MRGCFVQVVESVRRRLEPLFPELVRLRRELHRYPEIAFEERRTRETARAFCAETPGLEFSETAKTGLLAVTAGTAPGPTTVLRACLDALPITDEKVVPYASKLSGRCHACGHDAQVAALAGALRVLAEDPPPGRAIGLFQPAEEADTGAQAVLADGALDAYEPDLMIGFHGHPGLAVGQIGVAAGPIMAAITTVRCVVSGRGGHGAEPHMTADPVTAAAQLIVDWQVALGRRTDGRDAVVLSVGRLHAGTASNVIPDRVELDGTLRYLDPGLREPVERTLTDVAHAIEIRTGASVALTFDRAVPALVNDGAAADLVAGVVAETFGGDALVRATPSLGGDDFARYLEAGHRGCYVFVGERQEGRPAYGWHDPDYDLDERSIPIAAALLAAVAHRAARGGVQ